MIKMKRTSFKPYSIVEETTEETTYEFKTIYLWVLYGIMMVGMIGLALRNTTLMTIGGVCLVVYFWHNREFSGEGQTGCGARF